MSQVVIEQSIVAGSQFNGANGGATGTITTVSGALISPGDSFFLLDGRNEQTEFVFVNSPDDLKETDLRRRIVYDGTETASEIRDLIIWKVNHDAPRLFLMASDGGASVVSLLNRLPGVIGNGTPKPSTVGGGFAVSAMVGGVNPPPFVEPKKGMCVFEPSAFGGIFDFSWLVPQLVDGVVAGGVLVWRVERVLVQAADATSWSLDVVQPDGTSVAVADNVSAGGNSAMIAGPFILVGDERLRLVTSGATGSMRARVYANPERVLIP